MGDRSTIEWTDATWNPVRGCSIVSKGCTNCYAMRQAHRSSGAGGAYAGLTKLSKGGPVWTGEIRAADELLTQPLQWRRPRRIFVNSMSDLFHEGIPFQFIADVFAVMSVTTRHSYQILTKRPARMLEWFAWLETGAFDFPKQVDPLKVWPQWTPNSGRHGGYDNCGPLWPLENVWLGVSVEDQAAADERIPLLLETPAAVRWISAEPLLGPVELWKACTPYKAINEARSLAEAVNLALPYAEKKLDWIVAGGESGPGARASHPDWFRSLRDQCAAGGVPFFFKQWGNWLPSGQAGAPNHTPPIVNASSIALRITKRAAGRQLDGRTHDEYPA